MSLLVVGMAALAVAFFAIAQVGAEVGADLGPPSGSQTDAFETIAGGERGKLVGADSGDRSFRELMVWRQPDGAVVLSGGGGSSSSAQFRLVNGRSGSEQVGVATLDGEQYVTNLAWSQAFADPYLAGALVSAYTYAPLWRKVADAAAARRTVVRWRDLPGEVNGLYDPNSNTISISAVLKTESSRVVASALAHEAYHASHPVPSGVGAGLQEEINAYAWEAYVWSKLPRGQPTTSRELHLNDLVRRWRSQELHDLVVTMPGYQKAYLGRVLVSP